MFNILHIIYGIPITKNLWDYIETECIKENLEPTDYLEELGFKLLYSGDSYFPIGYFGENLKKIKLINEFYKYEDFAVNISKEKKHDIENKINKLPDYIKSILEKPNIYIIKATS